jgi:multisubunit Na+/H+ antiporter MnhB subunit
MLRHRPQRHRRVLDTVMKLPDYSPPNEQRAGLAIGLAPILVLLTFTLIVLGWIAPDTGIAAFLAFAVWVAYEMTIYQRTLDAYNAEYAARHLQWRTDDALCALAAEIAVTKPTREFVTRYMRAERAVMRDGEWC